MHLNTPNKSINSKLRDNNNKNNNIKLKNLINDKLSLSSNKKYSYYKNMGI